MRSCGCICGFEFDDVLADRTCGAGRYRIADNGAHYCLVCRRSACGDDRGGLSNAAGGAGHFVSCGVRRAAYFYQAPGSQVL